MTWHSYPEEQNQCWAPREFSQVCWYFPQRSGSEIPCSSDCLTRMCVYVFRGQWDYSFILCTCTWDILEDAPHGVFKQVKRTNVTTWGW